MAKRILLGLGILVVGVVALLSNIKGFNFPVNLWDYWPVFFILYGLGNMCDEKRLGLDSFIMMFLGIYLLASNLDLIHISFWGIVIPLLLIIIGFNLIFGKGTRTIAKEIKKNEFSTSSVFSDKTDKVESDDFKSANSTVVFGGSTLDLSLVKTKGKSGTLNLTVAFAGIDVKVPDDWNINIDGLICVFGGVEDSRKRKEEGKFTLYLTGCVAFGGVEIK